MAEEYSRTKAQRNAIKGRITRIYNFVQQQKEGFDINEYITRNAELEKLMERYDELQTLIEMKDDGNQDGDQSAANEEDRSAVETRYYTTRAALQKVIDAHRLPTSGSSFSSAPSYDRHISNDVLLPKLSLPTFESKISEWPTFKNIFMTTIGSSNMSPARKLQFLKTALKGEAAGLVSALFISDDNFQKAMDILITRYENKVIVVNTHLKSFLNHITITRNNLKEFLNILQQSLDSLNALDINTDSWDVLLVFLITQKLDSSLRTSWELSRKDNNLPTLKELLQFLNLRMTSYDLINDKGSDSKPQTSSKPKVSYNASVITCDSVCVMCKGEHFLHKCPQFMQLSPVQRNEYVKTNTLCFNCLKPYKFNHRCSKHKCLTCRGRHHTMLHMQSRAILVNSLISQSNNIEQPSTPAPVPILPPAPAAPTMTAPAASVPTVPALNCNLTPQLTPTYSDHVDNRPPVVHTTHTSTNSNIHVLLSTAIIRIQDATGQWHTARALLDSGSEVNLITSRLALKLKCKQDSTLNSILGIGASHQQSNVCIKTNIASRTSNFIANITCLVMDKITVPLPHFYVHTDNWNIPKLQARTLADPTFHTPSEIDILIGCQLFYSIITQGHMTLGVNLPHLINSVFGWIISGTFVIDKQAVYCTSMILDSQQISLLSIDNSCDKILSRFWEQEEVVNNKPIFTPDQLYCEQLFQDTTTVDNSGRYTVNMPINEGLISNLGNSFNTAYRCLLQLEARFLKDPNLYTNYKNFINEFLELGHAEVIQGDFMSHGKYPTYFLPHHAVIKPDNITTKLRTVFNASAKSSTGVSLNDILFEGPNIYNDVLDIILRYRMYMFVFSTDIIKMFRKILVNPDQRSLLRILWRDDRSTPLVCLQLKTVTYGTKCAPYLACRTLKDLAERFKDTYPQAAQCIQENCYMDDIISGGDDIESVKNLCDEIIALLGNGGFQLHKWSSNNKQILQYVTRDTDMPSYDFSPECFVKTLGLKWSPIKDCLTVSIPSQETTRNTKRTVLSRIAQIFDPLGLLAPVIINAKILMRSLWSTGLEWDSLLPSEIESKWIDFIENIQSLNELKIPRYYFSDIPLEIMLLGYGDASSQAYGACVYLRATYSNRKPTCTLVMAKTKVAPIKTLTVARLEFNNKIEWNFTVPLASHMGGIYEAGIKSVKIQKAVM
ncbi:uncharacterized protein LOC131851732 [Achroia grisella]|uniref:uncharacterized protein LOC131851732 n=1 Tax=Achroia grisella TaxID=688607 RepID=UPI0027D20A0A|nr:uncharacterized protein LOC131851732 [Achroia grisella]